MSLALGVWGPTLPLRLAGVIKPFVMKAVMYNQSKRVVSEQFIHLRLFFLCPVGERTLIGRVSGEC